MTCSGDIFEADVEKLSKYFHLFDKVYVGSLSKGQYSPALQPLSIPRLAHAGTALYCTSLSL